MQNIELDITNLELNGNIRVEDVVSSAEYRDIKFSAYSYCIGNINASVETGRRKLLLRQLFLKLVLLLQAAAKAPAAPAAAATKRQLQKNKMNIILLNNQMPRSSRGIFNPNNGIL